MTYHPKYFAPEELVPQEVYSFFGGNRDKIYGLFDDRLLRTADLLRDKFGPMIINNWRSGGRFQERGLRDPFTVTGAKWSDHKFGRALDCHFSQITPDEVRAAILASPWSEFCQHITALEMTVAGRPINWLHFATRNWDKAKHGILQLHL